MPTLEDDIKIIQDAVYGKEMRPAISDALIQSWNAVKIMTGAVNQLNERVDKLSGGTVDPDNPDAPTGISGTICGYAVPITKGVLTQDSYAGMVDQIL